MSGTAWAMLAGTWTVIIGFTAYFFGKVMRQEDPPSPEETGEDHSLGPPGP